MKHLAMFLPLALAGCGSALADSTVAVNNGRALLEVAHATITETCVPAYTRADTAAEIAAVDARCLPARTAYLAARAAWMAAVAALLLASAGGDPTAVKAATVKLAAAFAELAKVTP